MSSFTRMLAAAASAVAMMIAPFVAQADTPATFVNQSGRTLYVYYAVSASNVISCTSLVSAGTLAPGQQMQVSIPTGQWGWYRFQLDTRDNGCASYNNKFETRIYGVPNAPTQPIFVQ